MPRNILQFEYLDFTFPDHSPSRANVPVAESSLEQPEDSRRVRFSSATPSVIPVSSIASASQSTSTSFTTYRSQLPPQSPIPPPPSPEQTPQAEEVSQHPESHRLVHTIGPEHHVAPLIYMSSYLTPVPPFCFREASAHNFQNLANQGHTQEEGEEILSTYRGFLDDNLNDVEDSLWLLRDTFSRLQQLLVQYVDRGVVHEPSESDPWYDDWQRYSSQ